MPETSFVILYIVMICLLIIPPLCCSEAERVRWWRRLLHGRWNVSMDDYYASRRTSIEADRSNRIPSSDKPMPQLKEAEIRETYLIETMSPYSKTTQESDFVEHEVLSETQQSNGENMHTDYNNYCEPDDDIESDRKIDEPKIVYNNYCEPDDIESDRKLDESEIDCNNYCDPDDIESDRKLDESEKDNNADIVTESRFQNSDNNSTDGSVDTAILDDVFEDATVAFIKMPMPGVSLNEYMDPDAIQHVDRTVPAGCVICLNAFSVGDRVTWSSNAACSHLFHDECILDWLKTSGRKTLRRLRRQRESLEEGIRTNIDVVHEVTCVPWLCPVCRQDFIVPKQQENNDIVDMKVETNSSTASDVIIDGATLSATLEVSSGVHLVAPSDHVNDNTISVQTAVDPV